MFFLFFFRLIFHTNINAIFYTNQMRYSIIIDLYISLLSNISKVLEKVVQNMIYFFLTKNSILHVYDEQYGFRVGGGGGLP